MALEVCRVCKKAFIGGSEEEGVCPHCAAEIREYYPIVRNFLRDHEKMSFTAYEVGKILGIDIKIVEGLVALELIATSGSTGSGDAASKPLKIPPLSSGEARNLLQEKREGNSMHKYAKEQKAKGDKKRI